MRRGLEGSLVDGSGARRRSQSECADALLDADRRAASGIAADEEPESRARQEEACLISRQRLVGPVNGSSACLLGICKALREQGYRLTLVSPMPEPAAGGRFSASAQKCRCFRTSPCAAPGSSGDRLYVAKDPRVFLNAAMGVASKLAKRPSGSIWRSGIARRRT